MGVRTYIVTLTGATALLMHHDDIEWADQMETWKNNPANRGRSRAGDDRTPAWRWIGSLYHDNQVVAMSADNLMRCLMQGGAMVSVPGGIKGKTFKAQTQSGCMVMEPFWPLLIEGEPIPMSEIRKLMVEEQFAAHESAARRLGFTLFLKRAMIGASKHIRVRPRFDKWALHGTINVWDDQITTGALVQILEYAGRYKGLGDWRPGGKTPGPWGMFTAEVKLQ